jgi:hypothetical protein
MSLGRSPVPAGHSDRASESDVHVTAGLKGGAKRVAGIKEAAARLLLAMGAPGYGRAVLPSRAVGGCRKWPRKSAAVSGQGSRCLAV